MNTKEKDAFIDNIPDVYLYALYRVLFDPVALKMFNEKGGPDKKDMSGQVELEDGTTYYIWEEE